MNLNFVECTCSFFEAFVELSCFLLSRPTRNYTIQYYRKREEKLNEMFFNLGVFLQNSYHLNDVSLKLLRSKFYHLLRFTIYSIWDPIASYYNFFLTATHPRNKNQSIQNWENDLNSRTIIHNTLFPPPKLLYYAHCRLTILIHLFGVLTDFWKYQVLKPNFRNRF